MKTLLHPTRSALVGAALLCAASAASAAKLDLGTPEGATLAARKIQCSTKDNVPITYYWHGETLSRVPGEPDRRLFRVEGMNIRQCATVTDPVRGTGWRMTSREILLYLDPQTGEVLREWKNPWTGKAVKVLHVANDPVNQPGSFPIGRDGTPAKWRGSQIGNYWWQTSTIPLFYENPLGGDYQKFVGGTYHATEMFNFMGDVDDLVSDRTETASVRVGWVRVSSWLPWMEMGDRPGILYFHTAGRKLDRFADMSPVMLKEIEANYPAYVAPPPTDDTRPNETSWTYFRKQVPVEKKPGRE
jgi:hypothetical protein